MSAAAILRVALERRAVARHGHPLFGRWASERSRDGERRRAPGNVMNRFSVLLLAIFANGCDSPAVGPTPAPTPVTGVQSSTPPSPPAVASVRDVMLGERVEGVFGDGRTIKPGEHHFFLNVPKAGTLEVSLSWDPDRLGTLLMLRLEDRVFTSSRPAWSPVVGRLPVEAGGRYRIAVAAAGADWLPEDPFVVTSRLEP